ncbi:MAG: hemolysin family protein [Actinomycetaceae bacterium]|nr:hemolysin family protein [Arcanobacterium sp.]MDD7504994.1 hemolysin family protein [Actinomycetaceae bacterium]MDY6143349.1 hemolysin family protein [Arcanobacterium sp.]
MSLGTTLIVTVLLLIVNAYFVGAEFAVTSSRRSRLEPLAEAGKKSAQKALYALEHVTLMLATCQLGVTLASVALGAISEPGIAHAIEVPLAMLGIPGVFLHPIAFVIALLLVVFLHVVLGEMVPKNLAVTTPEKAALALAPLLIVVSKIFYPVVASLNWLANHFVRLLGFHPRDEVGAAFTADEVASIVEASQAAGVLDADAELISGALEFSDYVVSDVMYSLDDLTTLPAGVTAEDFERAVAQTGFSRYILLDPTGVPQGYLHLKDVLDVPQSERSIPISTRKLRPLVEVDPDDEVEAALRAMQRAGDHLAAVRKDGQIIGVIFLEDVIEELVGEIRDEMQK